MDSIDKFWRKGLGERVKHCVVKRFNLSMECKEVRFNLNMEESKEKWVRDKSWVENLKSAVKAVSKGSF